MDTSSRLNFSKSFLKGVNFPGLEIFQRLFSIFSGIRMRSNSCISDYLFLIHLIIRSRSLSGYRMDFFILLLFHLEIEFNLLLHIFILFNQILDCFNFLIQFTLLFVIWRYHICQFFLYLISFFICSIGSFDNLSYIFSFWLQLLLKFCIYSFKYYLFFSQIVNFLPCDFVIWYQIIES